MKIRPLALLEPQLGAVMRRQCTQVRRVAAGALADVGPGDVLWIREAFHLNRRYDAVSPTTALRFGAWPAFVHDFWRKPKPEGLGKRRDARALKKEWHRAHLVVAAVRTEPLQAITDAEVHAAGFADRFAFADDWNRNNAIGAPIARGGRSWDDNPEVLVFDVVYVATAAPAEPAPPPTAKLKPGPKPGHAAAKRATLRRRIAPALDEPAPEIQHAAVVAENHAAARRALAEIGGVRSMPGKASLSAMLKPVALTAPADARRWCDQCQERVTPDRGRSCSRAFCAMAPVRLEHAA